MGLLANVRTRSKKLKAEALMLACKDKRTPPGYPNTHWNNNRVLGQPVDLIPGFSLQQLKTFHAHMGKHQYGIFVNSRQRKLTILICKRFLRASFYSLQSGSPSHLTLFL